MAPPPTTDATFAAAESTRPVADTRATRVAFDPLIETESLDLVGRSSAVDATAYVWDLISDRIAWESNAASMLCFADVRDLATGHLFQSRIAVEHLSRRVEAIAAARPNDDVRGVPYRIQYRFRPSTQRGSVTIHLEDQGRWWPGADGRPERARGVLRIVNDSTLADSLDGPRREFDELTGQINRIRLTEALAAVIDQTGDTGLSSGFMMISVNNLAVINEVFGYDVGDEVIAAVGRQIKSRLRAGDVIGRYASNKFGVIMQDCGSGAMRVAAERFMKAVRDTTLRTSAGQLCVTISIGGVIVPTQASSVEQAVNSAMRAVERAKTKRFDCFMAHEANLSHDMVRSRAKAIGDAVIEAIDDRRMRLVLQPMIGAHSKKPEIYECLLRMERLDGSIAAAGEFIPVAEQLGLSRLIDRRTLELSVDLLKRHPDLVLSLNVSSLTCSDHEWLVTLRRLTGSRPELLARLVIEITETSAIQDLDQSINFVDTLKEMGCRVAIDDFGAGYTSFKNLKLLNVDIVKIDGAFVKNLANDTSDQIFVKTMIDLSRTFGIETVAEWVGDDETVQMLVDGGIDYLQGFHYGLPFDAADYCRCA